MALSDKRIDTNANRAARNIRLRQIGLVANIMAMNIVVMSLESGTRDLAAVHWQVSDKATCLTGNNFLVKEISR